MKSCGILRKFLSMSVSAVMVFGAAAANVGQTAISANAAVQQTVNEVQLNLWFEKPSDWGKDVYVYFYHEENSTVSSVANWPGVVMETTDNKVYSLSCTASSDDWRVIFNDAGSHQIPAAMMAGFEFQNYGYYTADGLDHIESGQVEAEEIKLDKESAEIGVGGYVTFKATVLPENAANKKVNWFSSDDDIAVVTEYGIVKGLKEGEVTITAVSDDNETLKASANVTVKGIAFPELNNGIYFEKPSSWGSNIYAYFYNQDNDASLAKWPGLPMTVTDVNDAVYKIELEPVLTDWCVIFSDTVYQSPAPTQAGFKFKNNGYYTAEGFAYIIADPEVEAEEILLDKDEAEIEVGEEVTLTATVLPENASNKTVVWSTSDESVATVADGIVKGLKAGEAEITAALEGNDDIIAFAHITVKEEKLPLVNNSSISKTKISLGETVDITKKASGGAGDYQYRIHYMYTPKESTTPSRWILLPKSENDIVSFQPKETGDYSIRVTVSDGDGNSSSKYFDLTVESAKPLSNTSKISAASIELGEKVTVTASASGGTAPYEYEVLYREENEERWSTLQALSENTVISFTPKAAGKYSIIVYADDAEGNEASKKFTLTVNEISALENTSTVSAEQINFGEKIGITASAKGGKAPYQYQVLYKQKTAEKWSSAQTYSANTAVSIKPTNAGIYDICVKVRDSQKKEVKKYFEVTVIDTRPKNISVMSASSIVLGENVVVTAKATGSTGFFQYAFYYKKAADTKWICRQPFKATSVATIKPSFAEPYDVCVKIKDDKGTIVKKYFTLDVTEPKDELVNNSAISETEINAGDVTVVSASAGGSTGFYQYAVSFRYEDSEEWVTVQDYSPENTVPLSLEKSGKYEVCVSVIDNKANEAKKIFSVTVL